MKYELYQIFVKTFISLVIIVPVSWGLWKLWKKDIDLSRMLNVRKTVESVADKQVSWLPVREAGAIYQDGKIVARIVGLKEDSDNQLIGFDEIYNSNSLKLDREFEFQKWRLKFESAETLIEQSSAAPQKGRIIRKAVCRIVGTR